MVLVENEVVRTEKFSNTETKVFDFYDTLKQKKDKNGFVVVSMRYETDNPEYNVNDDLMTILFVKRRLDSLRLKSVLLLWCMPYARMDRKIDGYLFTLDSICFFLNSLQFEKVVVIDPHSEETLRLLDRVHPVYLVVEELTKIKKQIGFDEEKDCIVFPDRGAYERYLLFLYKSKNICVFKKQRNNVSNDIVYHEIETGKINPGASCIVIDDLCSKGDTLLRTVEKLVQLGAGDIYLAVSHCENTALGGELLKSERVKTLFTSDSMMSTEHPKISYYDEEIRLI